MADLRSYRRPPATGSDDGAPQSAPWVSFMLRILGEAQPMPALDQAPPAEGWSRDRSI
ncbi:hypothetical protein [Azospirillum thermophilum]|nr:hypothetical protein [Azospirillum thermophilum]